MCSLMGQHIRAANNLFIPSTTHCVVCCPSIKGHQLPSLSIQDDLPKRYEIVPLSSNLDSRSNLGAVLTNKSTFIDLEILYIIVS